MSSPVLNFFSVLRLLLLDNIDGRRIEGLAEDMIASQLTWHATEDVSKIVPHDGGDDVEGGQPRVSTSIKPQPAQVCLSFLSSPAHRQCAPAHMPMDRQIIDVTSEGVENCSASLSILAG